MFSFFSLSSSPLQSLLQLCLDGTAREPKNLFFFIVRSARKNAYCISFHPPVFPIQFRWIFKRQRNDSKNFFRLERFLPEEFSFMVKATCVQRSVPVLRLLFSSALNAQKTLQSRRWECKKGENCRNVKNYLVSLIKGIQFSFNAFSVYSISDRLPSRKLLKNAWKQRIEYSMMHSHQQWPKGRFLSWES